MVLNYASLGHNSSYGTLPAARPNAHTIGFPTIAQEPGIVNLPPGSRTMPNFFAVGKGRGKKQSAAQQRSWSVGQMEIAEVRGLGGDEPQKGEAEVPRNPHEALMQRLKSRAARAEADNTRNFLAAYRSQSFSTPESERKLDGYIKAVSARSEDLRRKSEDLQLEATEAERKLEKAHAITAGRTAESELQSMSAWERSQARIKEDKREEEITKQRDEVAANYARVHRRLQNELIELRDFKVLLREFRRVRLEKLHDTLGSVKDGRRLRNCVKEMIRHGAQRILQKLEDASLPLEPWMCEVLVNCAHVEIRIEDAEEGLLQIRRRALQHVEGNIHSLMSQTKKERFDNLCTRTWRDRGLGSIDGGFGRRSSNTSPGATAGDWTNTMSSTGMTMSASAPSLQSTLQPRAQVPEDITLEMRTAEANIAALRRLLSDMRHNAAAVICNQIRQVEKGGGSDASGEAMEWGRKMLALLVSEDFAKATMKELQKSAPHAKLTQ